MKNFTAAAVLPHELLDAASVDLRGLSGMNYPDAEVLGSVKIGNVEDRV